MDKTTSLKALLHENLLKKTGAKCLLAVLLGSLSALAMAPFNIWGILFLTFGGFYILQKECNTPLQSATTAWCFGFGYFSFGLYWIGNALLVEGNDFIWAWPLAVAGLPALLSFFPAVCLYFWKKIYDPKHELSTYLGFVCALALSEYLRSILFTGFPWNLFGYTWGNTPLISQIVSVTDIYTLTFLTILWGSSLPLLFSSKISLHKKISYLSLISLTVIACALYGKERLREDSTALASDNKKIILIQPNIKQEDKWKPENLTPNVLRLISMTEIELQKANLTNETDTFVIWPETALPLYFSDDAGVKNKIKQALMIGPKDRTFLITGALTKDPEKDNFYNSLLVYNQQGKIIAQYNKSHLVPFGEYMPLENILDIAPVVGFKGFKKGNGPETINIVDKIKISPLICYEIIFPNKTVNRNEIPPNLIVNITNDGWYGNSTGPHQHLMQSRFRAIEEGIPVIRVANTGISAIITPTGKIVNSIDLEYSGTSTAPIPEIKKINTKYRNIGIVFITIISIFSYAVQIKKQNTSYN